MMGTKWAEPPVDPENLGWESSEHLGWRLLWGVEFARRRERRSVKRMQARWRRRVASSSTPFGGPVFSDERTPISVALEGAIARSKLRLGRTLRSIKRWLRPRVGRRGLLTRGPYR